MTEQTRWTLDVSREIDADVRTFLAERGGREVDLARFVEQAVAREMMRATLREVRDRNAGLDPEEIRKLVDEEVAEVRRARRGH